MSLRILPILICLFLLQGCATTAEKEKAKEKEPEIPPIILEQQFFVDLPGWSGDGHAEAFVTFQKTCERFAKKDKHEIVKKSGIAGTYQDWQSVCAESKHVDAADNEAAKNFFEKWFSAYLVRNRESTEDEGLFTGYYEPLLFGSFEKSERFNTPLYARPDNLIEVNLGEFRDKLSGQRIAGRVIDGKLKPYYERAEIEEGALEQDGEVILWVDNPVQAFFLHIQGSGRVQMDDGSIIPVGYAGQNGHVYYAIGRHLIDIGVLTKETVSLPSIRDWLAENSAEAQIVMNKNASYIFFRKLNLKETPLGAAGVPLTAGRSLAVDRKLWAYGMPMWIDVAGVFKEDERIRRLMVAQDTGGAIRGPVRGDFFWGHGDDAETFAGHMKSKGRYWVFLPRYISVPEELTTFPKKKPDYFKPFRIMLEKVGLSSAKEGSAG